MAKIVAFLPFCIFFGVFLSSVVVRKSGGLTLKLIHRDSPESPLHQSNLAYSERSHKSILHSKARARLLSSRRSSIDLNVARASATVQDVSIFLIKVGIGTFSNMNPPYISYFLAFDTGSQLIWIQCESCMNRGHSCFYQQEPIFPSSQSSSYRPVLCNDQHNLCPLTCQGIDCQYSESYMDQASTTGVFARETFMFGSSSFGAETAQLLFGCGYDQKGFLINHENNRMAGVMGAGWGPMSIVNQMQDQTNGRFSYCIPLEDDDGHVPSTSIRFGADIPSISGLKTTRLLNYGDNYYYVNMNGISLGHQRLHIYCGVFQRNGVHGGTIMDSGCQFSVTISPAFDAIGRGLQDYFGGNNEVQMVGNVGSWEVCLTMPETFAVQDLPTMTFHLEGGDLEVKAESLYGVQESEGQRLFCLAMTRSPDITLIGAFQQANQRFIFDTGGAELQYGPEVCHSGS